MEGMSSSLCGKENSHFHGIQGRILGGMGAGMEMGMRIGMGMGNEMGIGMGMGIVVFSSSYMWKTWTGVTRAAPGEEPAMPSAGCAVGCGEGRKGLKNS